MLAEALAVFRKDWRAELRTRYALATIALFAVSTLVVAGLAFGPVGADPSERGVIPPAFLWVVLLFAAASGLPRAFVAEEEGRTAPALRLAARPDAVFAGKLLFAWSMLTALEALLVPLFLALVNLDLARPPLFLAGLLSGGYALAAASTLIAALVAEARGRGALFPVLAFPVLVPALLLAVEVTRAAILGPGADGLLVELLLYDAVLTVVGLLLFPAVWTP